ncbi:MAG: methylated-DNA--[protein]-cysteine S-methyltransferase [Phycisphaerales bacterium]|nr:methylated-DNA--[protein]-cysteine S-methyltransferase [Phycisphaerales bacterium]
MLDYGVIQTDWGPFAWVASDRGLVATLLPDQYPRPIDRIIADRWPDARPSRRAPGNLSRAVVDYYKRRLVRFDMPLDLDGWTEFRRAVLNACRRIPHGRTASYADLARAAGRPAAVRAVGSTMAQNPIPLIIPCHRVIRTDGTLGGFSSPDGVRTKRRMLEWEGVGDLPLLTERMQHRHAAMTA